MRDPTPAMAAPSMPARGVSSSAFDAAAPRFNRHRALPPGVPLAIRAAVLAAVDASSPRLLDLGAGTGRIGDVFVAAGDDYVGVDLSLGMLREFARHDGPAPRLAQADGERLPFGDATFDAVLMIQVFGGMRGWRRVLAEARRVLRPSGVLVLGRSVAPADGVDARMKQRLTQILADLHVDAPTTNARENAEQWLANASRRSSRVVAATWGAQRTARGFLDRHRDGARFSALPGSVKDESLRRLADWASATYGSLDTACAEQHAFELQIFEFPPGAAHA
jgi:ubiquinone/menaquinone biosynthesis C-methylase UbiE